MKYKICLRIIYEIITGHAYSEKAPREHRDPFDRMLLCQAKAENLNFVTHDELIPFYNENCVISV